MTIYSLTCERCKKINCSKFYNCVHCNINQCKECLDETNPKRLTCRILKDDNCGIEKTIYCVNHCTKIKKFCGDCGKCYNLLKSCRKCKVFFCSDCRGRNSKNLDKYYIEGDNYYNQSITRLSNHYCSFTCFELDHIYHDDYETVCNNCGVIFDNSFNENECAKCLQRVRVDVDVDYNYKRIELQKKINQVMLKENVNSNFIEKMVERYMEIELIKNSFMIKNNLKFHDWITDMDEGSSKCFVMYDNCIIKVLKTFSVEISRNDIYSN